MFLSANYVVIFVVDDDIGDDSNLTITDNDADVELASCQQFVDAEIVQEIEASVRPMHSECAEDIDTDLTVKRLEEEEFRQVTSDCVAGLGPRPTAALLGLKESVEECLRVPTEKGITFLRFVVIFSIFSLGLPIVA